MSPPPTAADPGADLTLERWLSAVPVRNQAVQAHTRGPAPSGPDSDAATDPGLGDEPEPPTRTPPLTLFVPLRRPWWLRGPVGWLLPLRDRRGVALDGLGTWVWHACDGQRNLGQIVEHFARRQSLGFHEARLLVSTFLRQLTQRRLLVLMFPEDNDATFDSGYRPDRGLANTGNTDLPAHATSESRCDGADA